MRSLFTPEARGAVLQGVRSGLSIAEAAERAGLSGQLVRNWASQGRAEDGTGSEHAAFAEALDAAREEAATAELSEREFHAHLNRSVRAGSIQAARLWWTIHGSAPEPEYPPDALDALKAQRAARRAAAFGNNNNNGGSTA